MANLITAAREGMKYADLLGEVQSDWWAAEESRRLIEQRRVRDYQLYRRFRTDVSAFSFEEAVKGPFGWSSLTVPIIYWIIETIVPRVATQPPLPLVKAATPEAVPYAQAKELSLQEIVERMRMLKALTRALKEMVLYGDGFTKTTWDSECMRPRFTSIPWFDFFVSSEARDIDEAEVHFHRTWYTRRQLQRLSRLVDRDGKPLFHGLDQLDRSENIDVGDTTWAARREAAGLGPQTWSIVGGLYCLVECWYQDGTVVVLGGARGDRIVQVRRSPFRDEYDKPMRPFTAFSNTPDPEGPYSIGDAEMLEDHQEEASTLRNQAIDQTTVNLNGPVIYTGDVSKPDIDAAFGAPGGSLRVNGDVRAAVMRMNPGSISADFFEWNGNIRDEAQYISGVNDNQAGQAAARQQTATEIRTINQEANRRWQFKILRTEDAAAQVYRMVDLLDRRYGVPGRTIAAPNGTSGGHGQRGLITMDGELFADGHAMQGPGFLRTSPAMNGPGTAYIVTVKAGSMTAPSDDEELQKVLGYAQAVANVPPLAERANWPELGKMIAQAFGYPPEKVMISEAEFQQQQALAQQQAMMAAFSQSTPPAGNETAGAPQAQLTSGAPVGP